MYVRVIKKRLSTGHQRGDIVPGSMFKALSALLREGAVVPYRSAPLSELIGWKRRSEILADAGILTVVNFLEASNETVREAFGYKTDRAVKRMRHELETMVWPGGAGASPNKR